MYKEMLAKVMSNKVTLQDWQEFCDYIKTLPGVSIEALQEWVTEGKDLHQANKQSQEFVGAARHVASKLPITDIIQDTILTRAYIYIHHSADFS